MASILVGVFVEVAYLTILLLLIYWQRSRTPIDKSLLINQGMIFVGFAALLAVVGYGIQTFGIFGFVLATPENANLSIAVAAMLYVVPAVTAAIGANILTQYVLLGP